MSGKRAHNMRGRIASRAHSFKENILEVLGNHGIGGGGGGMGQNNGYHGEGLSSPSQTEGHLPHPLSSFPSSSSSSNKRSFLPKNDKGRIRLAKKNVSGSSDNILDFATPKTTECLAREVQLALRYFENSVIKGTLEMLPGCATVVLETVIAIQNYMTSSNLLPSPEGEDFRPFLVTIYSRVAGLTQWADRVIIRGSFSSSEGGRTLDHSEESVESVIEPVRKSVGALIRRLSVYERASLNPGGTGPKSELKNSSSFHNSLPDIASARVDDETEGLDPAAGFSRDSALGEGHTPSPPPELPERRKDVPPPLPPKLKNHHFYFEDNGGNHHHHSHHPIQPTSEPYFRQHSSPTRGGVDWFSNPIFERLPQGKDLLWIDQYSDSSHSTTHNISRDSFDEDITEPDSHVFSPPAHLQSARKASTSSSMSGGGIPPCGCRKTSTYDNVLLPPSSVQINECCRSRNNHSIVDEESCCNQEPLRLKSSSETFGHPPPLPPKKRNIMSYMEMFGKSMFPTGESLRQGLSHTEDLLHAVWQQNYHDYSVDYAPRCGSSMSSGLSLNFPAHNLLLFNSIPNGKSPFSHSSSLPPPPPPPRPHSDDDSPPALPPKQNKNRTGSFRSFIPSGIAGTFQQHFCPNSMPPLIPPPLTSSSSTISSKLPAPPPPPPPPSERIIPIIRESTPYFEQTTNNRFSASTDVGSTCSGGAVSFTSSSSGLGTESNRISRCNTASTTDPNIPFEDDSLLEVLDVTQSEYLLCYNGNEVRAGTTDALVILATQSYKNDFLFQEAFLATYRTFLSAQELLSKLVQRFRKFNKEEDSHQQRAAKSAFSLMVRVVDCLADCDFHDREVMEILTNFMSELVSDGELMLARALRSKFIQKYEKQRTKMQPEIDVSAMTLSTPLTSGGKPLSILSYKSADLAEQMTYMDSQLFLRLDAVELILWVQEQNEDKSPNLTKFTEHFNNMSFWCRTKILQQEDAKEREKYMLKFIKIMKLLRKHNNFNSYLAILSALDSAPVRRLEWQRGITEGLKEYCALIDSSSSFRAYRQALNESGSPCIPYVGLILQDLTFVHIGNPDTYDGKINFAKRWQQFNILDNLRRFRKETYNFQRKEDIISVFGDFTDYMSEDAMWQLSESIKPRGGGGCQKVNK